MTYKRQHDPVAFTLIELLVVVAIIVVLIAILVPGVAGAQKSARTVACLSNLKQIGVGLRMYADENLDLLPPGSWYDWTAGDTARWYTLVNPQLSGIGDTVNTIGIWNDASYNTQGQPEAKSRLSKLYMCPAATIRAGFSHYSSNPVVIFRREESGFLPRTRFGDLGDPAKIILLMDGSQNLNGLAEAVAIRTDDGMIFGMGGARTGVGDWQRYRKISLLPNMDGDGELGGRPRWRHGQNNNQLNAVFGDGHAATHTYGTLTEDNLFPPEWRPK